MKNIITIVLILLSGSVFATVYVNQNSSGDIEYTDTPNSNSNPVEVPAVNSVVKSNPVVETSSTTEEKSSDKSIPVKEEGATSNASTYTSFVITSPKNEETIQNQPVISVEMKSEPTIQPGDTIQIMVDGKAAGTPTATTYQEITNVERGTHTLSAEIINNKKEGIKRSPSITIHVHKNSINTSPAMRGPNRPAN